MVYENDYQESQNLLTKYLQELIPYRNNPRKSKRFQHLIYSRTVIVSCQINPQTLHEQMVTNLWALQITHSESLLSNNCISITNTQEFLCTSTLGSFSYDFHSGKTFITTKTLI